ncbi:hypothetical protein SEALOLALOVE_72 [Mycobacterium phage Lolalove]|uniref:Uncharacterized protein n=1 Tax=Mycobacterium phage Lolalove TaxID=2772027 RepID=A0A7L7SQD0_9CAUD|nr:hypothetical protein SEALOLALOVE_72 [Mycobacterium phage Lolalove]
MTGTPEVKVVDKRRPLPLPSLAENVAAQREQVRRNVNQLASTLWWKAQGSPTPEEALATRQALLMQARMNGLDV